MDFRLRGKDPSERPSHGNKVLGSIEKKYSGRMTDEGQRQRRIDMLHAVVKPINAG